MSQTTKASSYLTADRPGLLVLCRPAGRVTPPPPRWCGDSVWEAQQCTEATHQWVPFSLGSHCLLSTGHAGEQHNGVAGPLCLILMSYYSSPHYPCYWLVWSQPGVLGSNNKQSSFFSSLFSTSQSTDSHILWPILHPGSPAPSIHGLSISTASMRYWNPEVCNHTGWVEPFHPLWLNWVCSKAIIKKTWCGAHKAAAVTTHWDLWKQNKPRWEHSVYLFLYDSI